MESGVLNTPEVVSAFGKKCVAVKVDLDARSDLATKYGVAALPTDVFVSPEGEVLSRHVGQATRDTYLARIDGVGQKFAGSTSPAGGAKEDVSRLLTQLASAGGIGLDGYSPVSLTTGKLWREGSPEFAWRHAGVIYFMADAAELEQFKKSPEKYAPKFSGFDPLILSTEKVAVPGLIAYGSFYEGRLHLHATEESRTAFIKDPAKYPAPKTIEIPATIARRNGRPPVEATVSLMMGS
jgi:YHS domain-containing protein